MPYLTCHGLQVYVPTCSTKLLISYLCRIRPYIHTKSIYQIEKILNFVGKKCWCGKNHWRRMGWEMETLELPEPYLGINKDLLEKTIARLRRERMYDFA